MKTIIFIKKSQKGRDDEKTIFSREIQKSRKNL